MNAEKTGLEGYTIRLQGHEGSEGYEGYEGSEGYEGYEGSEGYEGLTSYMG